MNTDLLVANLTNPAFLYFILGILAVKLKSDLELPESISKFIALYLLLSIGFRGGQELSHETLNAEIGLSMLFGISLAIMIPLYTFFLLKQRLNAQDSAAIAAAYGSVSAVTFVTAAAYLESVKMPLRGHMVAIMALMESPAIVVGLTLLALYAGKQTKTISRSALIGHSLTNASVFLILGSLVIGYFANAKQAEGIKPLTNDLFKGFLALFLLDMGITSGRKLGDLLKAGWFPVAFAIFVPLINGCGATALSSFITNDIGNRFLFGILAASASYIAVPAAMKIANPEANPGIYLPMALAVTFPLNITVGLPLYLSVAHAFR